MLKGGINMMGWNMGLVDRRKYGLCGVAAGAKETTTGVGFAGYMYMQDITKAKCDSIASGTEGRLVDGRDGKIYWVGKMPDGLCWMTQNLDYDGYGDSVTTGFTSSDINIPQFYDPGEYVYTREAETPSCDGQLLINGLKNCTQWLNLVGWKSTDERFFVTSTEYVGTDGLSICTKTAESMFGDGNYEQCKIYYSGARHYMAGNYYNWITATDGSTTSTGTVNTSICPSGWKLPYSNTTSLGSFGRLVGSLSVTQVALSPYYFTYGGVTDNSYLKDASRRGLYWSGTTNGVSSAYGLIIHSSNVLPSTYNSRYYGQSVRCVAR